MTSRALRVSVFVLCVGVLAVVAYLVWTGEQQGRASSDAVRAFDGRMRTATRALLDVRHAQAGYVAVGQGEDFWTSRVDVLLAAVRESLNTLHAGATSSEAQEAIDAAAAVFDDFQQMDRRARTYARNGQRLLASDLVFSDGLDKIDVALGALDRAQRAEHAAAAAGRGGHRRAQLLTLGGGAAAGLLLMAVLVPLPKRTAPVRPTTAAPRPAAKEPEELPEPTTQHVTATPAVQPASPAPAVDLPGIAALCTDLARVLDVQALPPALERAARLLHASGIVIWITDPDRRELTPVAAHGYPSHIVARMGTIGCDDENVTAAAFRTGLVQIVTANGGEHGAIAAPLLTSSGSVGVMAAEVLPGRASDEQARAAAAILAAQLAALVGPPAAPGASGAAGTG